MGYYMKGDYGRVGGYYRGDGFWSSLGGALKKFAPQYLGFAGNLLTGNIPGAISNVEAVAAGTHASTTGAGSSAAASQLPSLPTAPGGLYASHASHIAAPSMPGAGTGLALRGRGVGPHMHISRRTGLMVKGRARRMNPLNVKALKRGIRRAHAFARIARSVVTFAKHGTGGTRFKVHHKRRSLR